MMKKIFVFALAAVMLLGCMTMLSSCGDDAIVVNTNAFFAPFEYYDGTEIKGVDVDIMNLVGEKLGRKVRFENTDFAVIIDNVASGKAYDCGAAGITITDARKERVDFSIPYYTSVQYVIWEEDDESIAVEEGQYVLWDSLAGKTIGVQTDTTGWIYSDYEISEGVLKDTNTGLKMFDDAQLASDAIKANQVDVVIVDELPAKYITEKNGGLKCLPLYYDGGEDGEDSPTEEQYAICVTKGNEELLNAINEVLEEVMKKDATGQSELDRMLMKHMGLE